jgi:hypothetical protein
MNINEINLNKVTHEELLNIYNRTKEFIEELDKEVKSNEVEKSK